MSSWSAVADGLERLVEDFSLSLILLSFILSDSQGICFFDLGLSGILSFAASSCDSTKLLYVSLGEGSSIVACSAENLLYTATEYCSLSSALVARADQL